MEEADSKYKVILIDSDPATPEGRHALEQSLVTFLELEESRIQELIKALPVTLKENIDEDEAKAFAKILREMGALVFVEKFSPENTNSKLSLAESLDKLKSIHEHRFFLPGMAIFVLFLLITSFLRPSQQAGIVIDSNSLATMLQSQKSMIEGGASKGRKKKTPDIFFSGKSYVRPVALTADAVEKEGTIIQFIAKVATESPGDLTPEEIIRGVQQTWLEKAEIYFSKREDSEDSLKLPTFTGEAKLYITRGELNERIVAEARLEQLPPDIKAERKFMVKIRYKAKDQFLNDPYFIEYKEDSGYSVVLNQIVTLQKKIENKETALHKLDKIEGANESKAAPQKKAEKK